MTASKRKTSTKLYDMLEREVNRLTVMSSLLTITLILSTVMLVIAVIIIASFRTEQFLLKIHPALAGFFRLQLEEYLEAG